MTRLNFIGIIIALFSILEGTPASADTPAVCTKKFTQCLTKATQAFSRTPPAAKLCNACEVSCENAAHSCGESQIDTNIDEISTKLSLACQSHCGKDQKR